MPLTQEQQAQLAELQAEAGRPPKRTDTGLAGVLHQLIDLATGTTAHISPDAAAGLHAQAEQLAGDSDGGGGAGPFGTETEPGE